MAAVVEIWIGKDGDAYFRVKAANGEVVLKGSEGYSSGIPGAKKGVASAHKAMMDAIEADNVVVLDD